MSRKYTEENPKRVAQMSEAQFQAYIDNRREGALERVAVRSRPTAPIERRSVAETPVSVGRVATTVRPPFLPVFLRCGGTMRRGNEDVSKLPKWAQSKIKSLESHLAAAKEELQEVYGNKPSNVVIPGFVMEKDVNLPVDSQVEFNPDTKDAINIRLDILNDKKVLVVSAGHPLHITPWATNMVKIWVET